MSSAIKKFYPQAVVSTIDGNGNHLTQPRQGLWVEIHKRNGKFRSAEVYSDCQTEYADIGLVIEGGELVDYDGVFSLPKEVAQLLRENGVKVNMAMMCG